MLRRVTATTPPQPDDRLEVPTEIPAHGRRRLRGDDGAVIVETALVAPLLFLLIFGIIEFGWYFYQSQNVRHGAREAARLAAVNYNPGNDEDADVQGQAIVDKVCQSMDTTNDAVTVNLTVTDKVVSSPNNAGRFLEADVSTPFRPITGFFPYLDAITLHSSVTMRLEQRATWGTSANDYDYSGTC